MLSGDASGTSVLNARFPGQWFQSENGLHYNWRRHYDPTTGRYTQADPLGFVNRPSLYAHALNSPQMYTDPDGRFVLILLGVAGGLALEAAADYLKRNRCSCRSGSSKGQYAASAAAGGVLGDQASPLPKSRLGVGCLSQSRVSSRLSSYLSSFNVKSPVCLWAPTRKHPFAMTRNAGRSIARVALPVSAAHAAYNAYRIVNCLAK
ncbi:RHS repeat-associated core domain-containing protein [Pyruvatibacter mobilis]|uniref:RHS repeat-associated core domain-containing protein n=1 Tax=Pyruvatibacter mobilis TaxID=1712261 RepID=UPI003BA8E6F6